MSDWADERAEEFHCRDTANCPNGWNRNNFKEK